MTNFYLDTSALVKLYVYESGTPQMLELASKADNQLTLSTLTQIEFHSAVRSRQRAGDLDNSVSESMLDRFDNDLDNRFNRQAVNGYVIDLAAGLVEQYPLRGVRCPSACGVSDIQDGGPGRTCLCLRGQGASRCRRVGGPDNHRPVIPGRTRVDQRFRTRLVVVTGAAPRRGGVGLRRQRHA